MDRPNVFIKIPGTPAGVEAIRRATAAGINVNVTLLFSVEAYMQVADVSGLEERVKRGESVRDGVSVASFFVSRVDTAIDPMLAEAGREDLAGRAGIANARIAYARFRELVAGERIAALSMHGARVQRPLWASTGVKDERYPDEMGIEAGD